MGHASPRAALIYQHATAERDQALAAALSRLAEPGDEQAVQADPAPSVEPKCSTNVRRSPSNVPAGRRSQNETPGQGGGDERTRTADPLRQIRPRAIPGSPRRCQPACGGSLGRPGLGYLEERRLSS